MGAPPPSRLRFPWWTMVTAVAAAFVSLIPEAVEALELNRASLRQGELWRILTCQLTHASTGHLVWDLLAFVGLGTAAELTCRRRFAACVLAAAAIVPLAVLLGARSIDAYRGLSGIDSALYALVTLLVLRQLVPGGGGVRRGAAAVLLAAFVAKSFYELHAGATVFVDAAAAGMVPVPLAHATGALIGTITASWPSAPATTSPSTPVESNA